ncbi:MAG: hypothetical protein FWF22_08330 [Treponema sp.]|nr:hypothetical protein [Treponema sp.]
MKINDMGRFIYKKISTLADHVLDRIPAEKRRIYLLVPGGLVLLAICLILVSIAVHGKNPAAGTIAQSPGIPADELFYPAEPDFVPSLLLKEPRSSWTADDLVPFWQDPGKNHEDEWRQIAADSVDKLMEGVK